MKYFIDFEATQFSQEIISIGCINEKGEQFFSYVKPSKKNKKLTSFIKDLTSISQETINSAPTADEVFEGFFKEYLDLTEPAHFYCYGDADETFCKNTLKKNINSPMAQLALSLIAANLTDIAPLTANHFKSKQNIALKKVAGFISENKIEQKHDALEDAEMLLNVYNFISETPPLENSPFETKIILKNIVKIEKVIYTKNNQIIELKSLEEAVDKALELMGSKNAKAAIKHPERIKNKILKSSQKNEEYIGCKWEVIYKEA